MTPYFTRLRSFGRIKTHAFSPRQLQLVEEHGTRFSVPDFQDIQDFYQNTAYPDSTETPSCAMWIKRLKTDFTKINLEIGFGGGEHLLKRANASPNEYWIGAEPFLNGWIKALDGAVEQRLNNVALYNQDVRDLLEKIPASSLDRICILYPDPWHKQRHHKRRIINDALIQQLAHVLKIDGIVEVATDIPNYAEWIIKHFIKAQDDFQSPSLPFSSHIMPFEGWPGTRYEEKAKIAGRDCYYLTFIRK